MATSFNPSSLLPIFKSHLPQQPSTNLAHLIPPSHSPSPPATPPCFSAYAGNPFLGSKLPPRRPSPTAKQLPTRLQTGAVCAQAAAVVEKNSAKPQLGTWSWKYGDLSLKIHYEQHIGAGTVPFKNCLLLPTISDVSTTEEWRAVAENLLGRQGSSGLRILIVDWPGLGLSDRPPIEYTADVLETFLVDLVNSADGPLGSSGEPPVIVGGGHAATIAVRAVKKGLVKARAIAAVAPTWAGPMPIVFGRSPDMETRYSLLRSSLRAPGVGWMMYNFLVSSPKNIRMQYLSHVYADPNNVSPSLVESRTALTKREGARYAPAAFLTGLLDPVLTRDEFLSLFGELEGKVPVLVLSSRNGPKRSKAEMEALSGARGVSKFVEVPGALLPQEEYPGLVSDELHTFLMNL